MLWLHSFRESIILHQRSVRRILGLAVLLEHFQHLDVHLLSLLWRRHIERVLIGVHEPIKGEGWNLSITRKADQHSNKGAEIQNALDYTAMNAVNGWSLNAAEYRFR